MGYPLHLKANLDSIVDVVLVLELRLVLVHVHVLLLVLVHHVIIHG